MNDSSKPRQIDIIKAETRVLILKSKIPQNTGHLAILFLMRTLFALHVIQPNHQLVLLNSTT